MDNFISSSSMCWDEITLQMPYLLFLVESDIHWSPGSQTPWAIDAKFLWAWLVLKALLLVSRCIFSRKFYWWGLSYFDLGFTAEVNFAFLSLEKHNFLDGPGIWKHLWERGSFDAFNTTVKGAWCPHWIVVALQCYCEILFVWPHNDHCIITNEMWMMKISVIWPVGV